MAEPKSLKMAVRLHCMECNGVKKIRPLPEEDCVSRSCALYPYRPWDGPGKRKRRTLSEAQKEKLREGSRRKRESA